MARILVTEHISFEIEIPDDHLSLSEEDRHDSIDQYIANAGDSEKYNHETHHREWEEWT